MGGSGNPLKMIPIDAGNGGEIFSSSDAIFQFREA
jgi:hypothetical protein